MVENISLDRDLNPGPKECLSCTIPLSYRTTCWLTSRYITKYLYPTTQLYIYICPWDRPVYYILACHMKIRPWILQLLLLIISTKWVFTFGTSVTAGEKYHAQLGFKPRVSGIPFLHFTAELPNHMLVGLRIYHQIPVPDYIAIMFSYLWNRPVYYASAKNFNLHQPFAICIFSSCKPFPKKALVFTYLWYKSFENTVEIGEIARNEQFILFATVFFTLLEKSWPFS